VHKEKSFECNVCNKIFPVLKRLYSHKKKHHPTPLAVSESVKTTPTTELEDFDCPICPNKFGNDENLKSHIWTEHFGESLTCSECKKTFTNKSIILSHVLEVHKRKTDSTILETNKLLSKLVGLIEEIKSEVTTKPSMFDSSSFLSKIANIKNEKATNLKSIQNEQKQEGSTEASEHIDTSVFKVPDPDFSIDNKDPEELKAYFSKQLDDFLIAAPVLPGCQMCPRQFTQNLSLFRHMRREHIVKCYTCQICERRFIGRKNLNEHFAHVHMPKKWKCEKCAVLFGRKYYLDRHIKSHHSETNIAQM